MSLAAKSQHYRTQGFETKFSRDKDLLTFERKVDKHLTDNGLDTIAYFQDPANPKANAYVITDHGRFDYKEDTQKANERASKHFDKFDFQNDRDAKEFLLNSVDEDLEKQLYENCDKQDCFIAYWLELIHIIRSVSVDKFDKIKQRIRNRRIANYDGENIEKLASDYLSDYKELHGAGMYDHTLSLAMVTECMKADGANEDFRSPLRKQLS